MSNLVAVAVIWAFGAVVLYWNLEGRAILPSNDHVRVVAILWPLALVAGLGWAVWKLGHFSTKAVVVDTAVSFQRVMEWRYHNGRLLAPPPKEIDDEAARAARAEVDKLLEQL